MCHKVYNTTSTSTKMPLSSIRNSFRRKSKPQKFANADQWMKNNQECKLEQQQQQHQRRKSPPAMFDRISDRKALWSSKVEAHNAKQENNPFSDKYKGPVKLDKKDPNYGRPDENSLTAKRARDGEAKLRQEVCDLCNVIFEMGQTTEDGKASIKFGKLFQIYNGINDKVVGLLLRARKKRLLSFEGEMLFQRRDDEKVISLTKSINSIFFYFGREPDVVQGGQVDYSDPDIAAVAKDRPPAPNVNNNKTDEITPDVAAAASKQDDDNNENQDAAAANANHLCVRENSKKKKSSVIQRSLSQLRKRSTRKKSERTPAAATTAAEAAPAATPESTLQALPDEPEADSRKKSAVATLFVNLARKPSMAMRKQKKSASPPPVFGSGSGQDSSSAAAAADSGRSTRRPSSSAATAASNKDDEAVAVSPPVDTTKSIASPSCREITAKGNSNEEQEPPIQTAADDQSSEPVSVPSTAAAAAATKKKTAKERWRMVRNVSRALGRLTTASGSATTRRQETPGKPPAPATATAQSTTSPHSSNQTEE